MKQYLLVLCLLCSLVAFGQKEDLQALIDGEHLLQLARFDEASQHFTTTTERFYKDKKYDAYVKCQVRLAETYFEMGKYAEMRQTLKLIEAEIARLKISDDSKFLFWSLMTGIYTAFAKPDTAIIYQKLAKPLNDKNMPPAYKADYYCHSASLAYFQNEYDKANMYYDSAIALYDNDLPLQKVRCYYLKQRISYREKDNEGSKRNLNHIHAILTEQKITHHPLWSRYHEGVGFLNFDGGEVDTALVHFTKAYDEARLFLPEMHIDIAAAYNQLGISTGYLRKDSLEIIYHQRAAKIRSSLLGSDNYITSISYLNLGNVYRNKRKDYDSARYYYEQAAKIRQKVLGAKHPKMANAWLKLAELSCEMQDFERGLHFAHLALCAAHPTYTDTANIYGCPALGDYYRHEFYLAVRTKLNTVNSILPSVVDSGRRVFLLKLSISLIKTIDTLFENNFKKGFIYNEIWHGTVSSTLFLGLRANKMLYDITHNYQYFLEAGKLLDKSMGTELFDEINLSRAKDDSLVKKYMVYRNNIFQVQKKLVKVKNNKEAVLQLNKTLFFYNDTIAGLQTHLRSKYPEIFHKLNSQSGFSSTAFKKLVDKNTAVIAFSGCSTNNMFSYLLTRDTTLISFTQEAISSKIGQYRDLIDKKQNFNNTEFCQVANDIYHALFSDEIKKVLEASKIKKLIIVPTMALWYIPFEALLTDKPKNPEKIEKLPYLINKYQVSYAPSLTFAIQSLQKREESNFGNEALLVAPVFDNHQVAEISGETRDFIMDLNQMDSVFCEEPLTRDGKLKSLPFSEKEVANINKLFLTKHLKTEVLLRSDATLSYISDKLLNYRIIHFASHAYANRQNPDLSGILLSSECIDIENILFGGQIKNLDIQADLIVLSACETGAGKIITGEGINNLSGSFAVARVPNVISSLWKVADESTSILMLKFYDHLLKTNYSSYSESLRQAKLELIRQGKFAQPFYWAPFVITRY
jgi:CHAT domain-containing protein